MSSDDIPVYHLRPSLIDLIKRGESAPVIHYLEEHPDEIHQPDEHGFYPLHHAIQEKNEELIVILLEYGASTEVKSPELVSTAMLAALHGVLHLVQTVGFDSDGERNYRDEGGNSLFHYLAFNGSQEQWKLIKSEAEDILATNNSGKSALRIMVEEGHTQLFNEVSSLKSIGNKVKSDTDQLINASVRSGKAPMLQLLLDFWTCSENDWNSLVEQCCVLEKESCLKAALDFGNEQGFKIDSNRLNKVPSGLISPEIKTLLSSYL